MIKITLTASNDGAESARTELREFLGALADKMSANAAERIAERATRAYVFTRHLLAVLDEEIRRQEQLSVIKKFKQSPLPSPVREERERNRGTRR